MTLHPTSRTALLVAGLWLCLPAAVAHARGGVPVLRDHPWLVVPAAALFGVWLYFRLTREE